MDCGRSLRWRGRLESHDLESGIHVENVSGDAAAQVAAEKYGGVGDFGDIGVAAERGVFLRRNRGPWKNP